MSGDGGGTVGEGGATLLTEVCLERYGALSGASVALGAGVTVVTGPNEAGKSTLLAALGDLLWGLPLKSPRYALTPRSAVRVAATLGDGSKVVRTNRGLMAADGITEVLSPWGTDGRAAWDDGLGLDHRRLREGGRQVFAGGGDLARLVFTARSGFTGGAVLDALDERAEALYRRHRGAKTVAVRVSRARLDAVRAEVTTATTRASEVVAAERDVEAAAAALRRADAAEDDAAAAHDRAERAVASAADAAELRAVRDARRDRRGEGDVLDAAALASFDAAAAVHEAAVAQSSALQHQVVRWRSDLEALRTAPELIADAEAVEALHAQAQAREADAVRAGELAERAAAERAEAGAGAGRVSAASADPVPVDLAAQVEAASAEHPPLQREAADARTRLADARAALTALEAGGDLPDVAAVAALQAAVQARSGDASPVRRWREARAGADAAVRECEEHLREADVVDVAGALAAAGTAPVVGVPAEGEVATAADALEEARGAHADARRGLVRAQASAEAAREAAAAEPAPEVDREAVAALREERDALWRRVLDASDAGGVSAGERSRYQSAVAAADDGADALVVVADRLARAQAARRELARAAAEQQRAQEALDRAGERLDAAEKVFAALWTPAGARVPEPQRADAVRRSLAAAARCAGEARQHTAAADREAAAVTAAAGEIADLLVGGVGDDGGAPAASGDDADDDAREAAALESLLARASVVIGAADDAREARAARTRAAEDVRAATSTNERADAELSAWAQRWSALLEAAGLPPALDPTGWAERVKVLARVEEARARAEAAETSAAAARRAWDSFTAAVAGTARRHGEDTSWSAGDTSGGAGEPVQPVDAAVRGAVAATVASLWRRLEAARADAGTSAERQRQLSQADEDLQGLGQDAAAALAAMATALGDIGGDPADGADLPDASDGSDASDALDLEDASLLALLARSRAVVELDGREHDLLGRLETRTPAGAEDVESLVASLADVDAAALRMRLSEAQRARTETKEQRSAAAEDLGAARTRLQGLTRGSTAADLRAREAEAVAELAQQTERYALTHLQRTVLREQLEEHSSRHANPLLEEAGHLLETLTAGRWVALASAAAPGGEQTLRVVDAAGARHEPSQLSEGTADQVFLALRLAGIAQVAAERSDQGLPALPVVLDDALMTFDDERATAALRLVAGCGQQAVVLSHHEHLADLASGLGRDDVRVARLDGPGDGAAPETAATVRAAARTRSTGAG